MLLFLKSHDFKTRLFFLASGGDCIDFNIYTYVCAHALMHLERRIWISELHLNM